MASFWFEVGEGQFLEASRAIRARLKRCKEDGDLGGSYRLGGQRREDGRREIEVIYDGEDDLGMKINSYLCLGI